MVRLSTALVLAGLLALLCVTSHVRAASVSSHSAASSLSPLEGEDDDVDAVFESDDDSNYDAVDYGTEQEEDVEDTPHAMPRFAEFRQKPNATNSTGSNSTSTNQTEPAKPTSTQTIEQQKAAWDAHRDWRTKRHAENHVRRLQNRISEQERQKRERDALDILNRDVPIVRLTFDAQGRPAVQPVANGPAIPVPLKPTGHVAIERDVQGRPVVYDAKFRRVVIPLDAAGRAVVHRDTEGRPFVRDADGQPVRVALTAAGHPVPLTDSNGRPIVHDLKGKPLRIDVLRNGLPKVTRDRNTNLPIATNVTAATFALPAVVVLLNNAGSPVTKNDTNGMILLRAALAADGKGEGPWFTPRLNQTTKTPLTYVNKTNKLLMARPLAAMDVEGRPLRWDDNGKPYVLTDDGRREEPAGIPDTIPSPTNLLPGVKFNGKPVAAADAVTITIGDREIDIVKVQGPAGPAGPQGPQGEKGKDGVIPANITDHVDNQVRKLAVELRLLQGSNELLRKLEQNVFPNWASSNDSCPDGWVRLGYVEQEERVHCSPPGSGLTPLNKACDAVAKFPQHYDRCAWSMYCRAEWSKYGCYPFMTEEMRRANVQLRDQVKTDATKASASASKSLEDVVARLSATLTKMSSHDDQAVEQPVPRAQEDAFSFTPAYDGRQPSELERAQQLVRDILSRHASDSSLAADAQMSLDASFIEKGSAVDTVTSLAPNAEPELHVDAMSHAALPGPFVPPTFVAPPTAPAPFERPLHEFAGSA